ITPAPHVVPLWSRRACSSPGPRTGPAHRWGLKRLLPRQILRRAMFRVLSLAVASLAAPAFLSAATVTPRFARPTIPLRLAPGAATDEIASGDFNGDGLVDVINPRRGRGGPKYPATTLINKGRGRSADATKPIFAGPPPLTQHPRQIVVADFNGDGRADAFIVDHGTDQ